MGESFPALAVPPDLEARTRAIGRELYDRVAGDRHAFFRTDRWTGAVFDWALGAEPGRSSLLFGSSVSES